MKVLFIDGVSEGIIEEADDGIREIIVPVYTSVISRVVYKIFHIHTTHEMFGIATCEEKAVEDALTKLFEKYNELKVIK